MTRRGIGVFVGGQGVHLVGESTEAWISGDNLDQFITDLQIARDQINGTPSLHSVITPPIILAYLAGCITVTFIAVVLC